MLISFLFLHIALVYVALMRIRPRNVPCLPFLCQIFCLTWKLRFIHVVTMKLQRTGKLYEHSCRFTGNTDK